MPDQPWFQINRDLLVYKAFYFFFLSGFGSIFPYLPVYFRQIGLPASQVGLLLGLRPIVQLASAPFWAIMADKYRKRKSVLVMSVLSWLIMTLALAFVEPTNEICEIRQGNNTHKHVVNYTKVKTGFFRRSLWHRAKVNKKTEDKWQEQQGLEVVPIHIGSSHSKRLLEPISRVTFPKIAPKTINRTQLRSAENLNFASRDRGRFPLRNASLRWSPSRPNEAQEDTLFRNSNSSSPKNFKHKVGSEVLSSKDNTLRERFDNKQEPRLKTRENSTSHFTTSRNDAAWNEQIQSRHFSRFHAVAKSQSEENTRKNPSKKFTQKGHERSDSEKLREKSEIQLSRKQIIKKNSTSNFVQSAKESKMNQNSSFDKRRESKGSPPVVIEFSRIIIPHGIDKNMGNPQPADKIVDNNFSEKIAPENLTSFVSPKTGSQLMHKESHRNMSDILRQINKEPSDAIAKGKLLQLEEKLLKIGGFENRPKVLAEHSPIVLGTNKAVSQLRLSETTIRKSSFSNQSSLVDHKSFLHISVHDNKKNFSNESGEVSNSKKLLETEISQPVIHSSVSSPSPDNSAPNDITNKDDSDFEAQTGVFASKNSSSGAGAVAVGRFPVKLNNTTEGKKILVYAENEEQTHTLIKAHDSLKQKDVDVSKFIQKSSVDNKEEANNQTLSQTIENLSETSQSSLGAEDLGIAKKTESNLLEGAKETHSHIMESPDSRMQIWMINLLKTNTFELKRIFTILLVLVVVGEFLEAPSTTLADASLLEHLGEERRYYGKQRLWGSLGFGLSSFFVGVLLERSRHVVCGDQYTDYMICFCVFALLMVTTLFISTTFKFKYKETDATHASVFAALCNIHYGSCLVAACFMGVGHGMSHSFLNWFLEDLGATKTLMGVAVISRSTFDLLTFFVAGSLIKAIGQIKIMIFALISYGIAFTLYSLLTNPWWVLPIEMLVGSTYAASWSAFTSYMAGAASSESVTTIQGILQGVYWGLGTGSGTIAGGFLIHHIGAVATFRCVACCAFVVCVLFCLAQFKWTKETTETRHMDYEYTYLPSVESKDTEELLRGYRVSKNSKAKQNTPRNY
ncbi:uncharacterized protein [Montipora foliosa]|uniref:uncharacterized protein n=1 Tax=Montipora foliosa TaxID=591990 RepID=UPI0035F1AE64